MSRPVWKSAISMTVVLFILMLVPGLIWAFLGFTSAAALSGLGAVFGALATLTAGSRIGVRVSIAIGIAAAAALPASQSPWLAFFVFVLIGVGVGVAGRRGEWLAYTYVPIAAAFVLGEDPRLTFTPVLDSLILGSILAITGLVGTAVMAWMLRRHPQPVLKEMSRQRANGYGLILGLLIGVAAYVVVDRQLGHTGSWVILTIVVVFQPYLQDGWLKALHRAGGTILGFVIAIGIAAVVSSGPVLYILASGAALLCVVAKLEQKPYWIFATPLTVSIVLLEGASNSIVDTAEHRLLATLIGAGAALAVMAILRPFVRRDALAKGYTHY